MDDVTVAVEVARAGAEVVRRSSAFGVAYKDDASPVTEVDEAAEAAMLHALSGLRPDDAVVAEESGGEDLGGRIWYIDPLDGTVNFINGIPQVSVSVGLWDDDKPLAAAVLDVYRDELFTAATGQGCRLDDRPIEVSGRTELGPAVVATGFPYDHRDHADAFATALRQVLAEVQGIRRFGSAALDLAWTAAGRLDGYYEIGIAPWDIAAGIILVTEAGGAVTDFSGDPITPRSPEIIAAAPGVASSLRAIVGEAFRSGASG